MMMKNKKSVFLCAPFTLLETVIAIAILGMSMVAMLSITMNSAKRMGKAFTNWEKQHMLEQATEYYLLAGPRENIPDEFFPFEGYSAQCEIEDPNLPEEVKKEIGSWRLVTLRISIHDSDGEVDAISIDQILRDKDVE